MDVVTNYSRRSFFWIIFIMAVLCLLVESAGFFTLDIMTGSMTPQMKTGMETMRLWFAPVTSSVFAALGFVLWLALRGSVTSAVKKAGILDLKTGKRRLDTKKKPDAEDREKKLNDRRLFLHMIAVLQREGRLLDFFSEDLDAYEDDQIGAAVRSIQESCKKTMGKYLTCKPVLNVEEEAEYTVPAGFDPGSIKLTGNVTGEPPFKGVVRHRGWKAAKLEMPMLSESRDPDIISPAEVEIL